MTTLEILRGMRELLADPKRWTKETYARDAQGEEVLWSAKAAVCWCLAGASEKIGGAPGLGGMARVAIEKTLRGVDTSVAMFNDRDETTHVDVLVVLDKTIAAETIATTPFTVWYADGATARFSTFPEALAFYREHDGYALRNEERVGDGTPFDGLTSEEREQVEQ